MLGIHKMFDRWGRMNAWALPSLRGICSFGMPTPGLGYPGLVKPKIGTDFAKVPGKQEMLMKGITIGFLYGILLDQFLCAETVCRF
jgi:hypothetical protein